MGQAFVEVVHLYESMLTLFVAHVRLQAGGYVQSENNFLARALGRCSMLTWELSFLSAYFFN